jgi:hypothetical protein
MNDQSHKRRIPTSLFCVTCYFMAALALCFEVLPPDAWAIVGGRVQGDTLLISLAVGGTFLALGVALHIIFYRLSPARFDVDAFRFGGIGMIVMLACMFGLSIALARGTGLPAAVLKERVDAAMVWIGAVVGGLVFALLAFILAYIFIFARRHRGNRIARRLAAGDIDGAIRIGEERPPEENDFTTNVNLALAYAASGAKDKARQLVARLERTDGIPKYYTEETFKQTLDQLKELIERERQSA